MKGVKNLVVIQARAGSTRLPGKIFMPLNGIPTVDWIVMRVRRARLVDQIVFAVPDTPDNDPLREHLQKLHVDVFSGSQSDVLGRMYTAAKKYDPQNIIRICADNPFVSPEQIDELIKFFELNDCDYAYNHIPKNNLFPDGLGAEIVRFKTFQKLNAKTSDPQHREHCFNFIHQNPGSFRIRTFDPVDPELRHPEIKLDIDTRDDLDRLSRLDVTPDSSDREIVAEYLRKL